jgi:hypothetical protein
MQQSTSPTLVAADMVRAVLFDKCFRPLRILCSGVDLPEWHPLKMAAVADKLEEVFEAVSEDPMSIMEEDYECFSGADFPCSRQRWHTGTGTPAEVSVLWLDRATIQFRFFEPSSVNTALQLVLRPQFLVHFV